MNIAPLKTPTRSELALMLEFTDRSSGPPLRNTEAGEPTVLLVADDTSTRRRPLV